MTRRPILALAVAAALHPLGAGAVGVGDITIYSALNEVLNAQISLHKVDEAEIDNLSVSLASSEAFAKAGLERPYYLTDLKFSTRLGADGKPLIQVMSRNPIREPFLNFLVEVNWPRGKVMREFTLLLDPPSTFKRPPPPLQAVQSQAQPIPLEVRRPAVNFTPPPATEYRVEANDTLWSIAQRYRPEGVSIQEMLMAIYRSNPHAFARNNMNLLLAGRSLKIPGAEALASSNEQEARRAYQARLEADSAGLADGVTQPQPIDARGELTPPPEQMDRLEIVTPSAETAEEGTEDFERGAMNRLERDLLLARELNEKVSAENNELQQRLQRLESQLMDLERLLKLKSDSAAQVQEQLAEAEPQQPPTAQESAPESVAEQVEAQEQAPESAPEPAPEADPAEVQDQTAQPASGPEPAPQPDAQPISEAPAEPPEQPATEAPADTQQAEPPPQTQPQPAAQSGLLDMLLGNPLLLPAAGGLLILLLLLLFVQSRRKGKEEPQAQAEQASHLADQDDVPSFEDIIGDEAEIGDIEADEEAPQSSLLLDFTPSELEGLGSDTEIDPVSEADVYVAYGRYNQALDLLREGMENSPERSDIKVKLLEVLHAAGEREEFLRQVAQFANEGLAKKDPTGWARVSNLGRQLDPDHPLFVGTATAAVATAAAAASGPEADAQKIDLSKAQQPETETLEISPPEEELQQLDLSQEAQDLPEEEISIEPVSGPDQESGFGDDLLDLDELDIPELDLDQSPTGQDIDQIQVEQTQDQPEPAEPEPVEPEAIDLEELELAALEQSVDEMIGSEEEEPVLGRDADRDEPQEPIIDLSNEEDLQALKEIEALSGTQDADPGEGIFKASDEGSLDALEAELSQATEGLSDQPQAEPTSASEDAELDSFLDDLGEGLEADNADLDLESELSDLDLELSSGDQGVDLESELAELDKELAPREDIDQQLAANGGELDQGLEGLDLLDDSGEDHNQTKLELAEAYVDMGDPDGARAILEEVLAEGSAAQKNQANDLIAKLG
ncbi:MAG: LysM peptidoglycan-binding domain-containing protein [Gammaproteobacteria bacterium SHHR-1]|uniref:FimV/HubP family polar landmark protein n=1 Tax=Magnetovirga frankeli TaxID=947516 RepID=UPI0012938655|nr:LysM peptidoglycan-binding domain-containing protein [gamma proteobacterium SS-5]